MDLFFTGPENISDGRAVFDEFEARHIVKTLRRSTGDTIEFTDGAGGHFRGTIRRERPVLEADAQLVRRYPPPEIRLTAGIGFIRQARLDLMIEKGTELGIDRFLFFDSKHANYFTDNINRWQKISRQAVKQSLRFHLPEFGVFHSFGDFLDDIRGIKYKLLAEQTAGANWTDAIARITPVDGDIVFVIGPEGGLEERELQLARSRDFTGITFGAFRLRTETAVLSAAALVNTLRT